MNINGHLSSGRVSLHSVVWANSRERRKERIVFAQELIAHVDNIAAVTLAIDEILVPHDGPRRTAGDRSRVTSGQVDQLGRRNAAADLAPCRSFCASTIRA